MGILDWAILAGLAALFVLAVRYCLRHKGCGGYAGCQKCSGDCEECTRREREELLGRR